MTANMAATWQEHWNKQEKTVRDLLYRWEHNIDLWQKYVDSILPDDQTETVTATPQQITALDQELKTSLMWDLKDQVKNEIDILARLRDSRFAPTHDNNSNFGDFRTRYQEYHKHAKKIFEQLDKILARIQTAFRSALKKRSEQEKTQKARKQTQKESEEKAIRYGSKKKKHSHSTQNQIDIFSNLANSKLVSNKHDLYL